MGTIDRPSMLRLLAPLLLLGSVLQGALLAPAKAHQIESALQYLDGDLQLSSSFSNGEPTQGAVVRLLNADGTPGPRPSVFRPTSSTTRGIWTESWTSFPARVAIGWRVSRRR